MVSCVDAIKWMTAVIHVMDLLRSEGKEGLTRILEKENPGEQACEMWLPKQRIMYDIMPLINKAGGLLRHGL
jgi:hypothetical protein